MEVLKERNNKIDFIRGIAIILVICGHSTGLVMNGNPFDIELGQRISEIIYTFHMPLFFIISGYLEKASDYSNSKVKLSSLVVKNIISLYIPFLFLNYLYWFERLLANKLLGLNLGQPLRMSVKEIIELFYICDGASWFLLSLLLIKLLFEILHRNVPEFIILIVFSVLFWLGFLKPGTITEFLGWGMFYCIGHLINEYELDIWGGRSDLYRFYALI